MKNYQVPVNIYKDARFKACERCRNLNDVEYAARELNVSATTLRRYESGEKVPEQMVVSMSQLYGEPGLRLKHCKSCPIGEIEGFVPNVDGIMAVGYMIPKVRETSEKSWNEICKILADGNVNDYEKKSFIDKNYENVCESIRVLTALKNIMDQWDEER